MSQPVSARWAAVQTSKLPHPSRPANCPVGVAGVLRCGNQALLTFSSFLPQIAIVPSAFCATKLL
eukprot:602607-Prymnesium_polylepis.2